MTVELGTLRHRHDHADLAGRVAVVRPGRILFEMEGVSAADARRAMELAAAKLPIHTRFATRFGETGVQ